MASHEKKQQRKSFIFIFLVAYLLFFLWPDLLHGSIYIGSVLVASMFIYVYINIKAIRKTIEQKVAHEATRIRLLNVSKSIKKNAFILSILISTVYLNLNPENEPEELILPFYFLVSVAILVIVVDSSNFSFFSHPIFNFSHNKNKFTRNYLKYQGELGLIHSTYIILIAAIIQNKSTKISSIQKKIFLKYLDKNMEPQYHKMAKIFLTKAIGETINIESQSKVMIRFTHRVRLQFLHNILRFAIVDKSRFNTEIEDLVLQIASFMKISNSNYKILHAMYVHEKVKEEQSYQHYTYLPPPTYSTNYLLKEAYSTLGISPQAENNTIKKAYRKLAMKYHPDKHVNKPENDKLEARNNFEKITKAYDYLREQRKF